MYYTIASKQRQHIFKVSTFQIFLKVLSYFLSVIKNIAGRTRLAMYLYMYIIYSFRLYKPNRDIVFGTIIVILYPELYTRILFNFPLHQIPLADLEYLSQLLYGRSIPSLSFRNGIDESRAVLYNEFYAVSELLRHLWNILCLYLCLFVEA